MAASEGNERRTRLTRAQAREQTRSRLLDAAAAVIARKGLAGASVEEIAETAGYSIGALYSNFDSKERLFLELLSSRADSRVAEAADVIAVAGGEGYTAARGLGRLLTEVADHDVEAGALQAEFWLYAVRNPGSMPILADGVRRSRHSLEQLILSEFRRRGTPAVHPPADSIATVVFALFQGLVKQRRIDPDAVPEELFETALTWLFTGLAGADDSAATAPGDDTDAGTTTET
jgi:AcrR family transcriptional regulator